MLDTLRRPKFSITALSAVMFSEDVIHESASTCVGPRQVIVAVASWFPRRRRTPQSDHVTSACSQCQKTHSRTTSCVENEPTNAGAGQDGALHDGPMFFTATPLDSRNSQPARNETVRPRARAG